MATLTIRNLDPAVKDRLRVRAAEHGQSMEAEARAILQAAVSENRPRTGRELYQRIRKRFEAIGGVELDIPKREEYPDPPKFD